MKLEKREITLNESDSLKDLLFFEKALLNEYVEALEKVKRKETRETLMKLMRETAEELFLAKDLFDKSMGKS